jgi:uncharacterized membrane protein YccC
VPAASGGAPPTSSSRSATGLLLYGARLWVAVCLALYVAFWLELQNPFWAGTTAAIVCQPVLGASLRKGWFRLIGTVIGGIASVVLTAAFPQSRAGFLLGLALWCAACAFVASLLRNFASYAAALAGYTAAIVAGDELGLVGGANGDAFQLAVARVSEIAIGIACAGLVLATTDFGEARLRLAGQLAALGSDTLAGVIRAFRLLPTQQADSRAQRRALIQRAGALETVIDQTLGEESALRFRPRPLQAAVDGLFYALSGWRTVAAHLERLPDDVARRDAESVLRALPGQVAAAPGRDSWRGEPQHLRRACLAAARRLLAMNAETPSLRLLADRTAEALLGLRHVLAALLLLQNPRASDPRRQIARIRVPDILPPLVNAIRAFVAVGATALLWIVTAWPGGATALIFTAVTVTLFSPREDAAYGMARSFMLGTAITAALAWMIGFGVLPRLEGFVAFSLALGLVLVPGGALSAGNWAQPVFVALTANFVPLLGPANPMVYDVTQFYNTAIALLAGVGIALLAMQLVPPISPALRAQRLLLLTLRDLRRLAVGGMRMSALDWENRIYGRLAAMPTQVDALQNARLLAAMAVGTEILRLRRLASHLPTFDTLRDATAALARGDSAAAIADLQRFEAAAANAAAADLKRGLRACGAARVITEALAQHASYFDAARP